MITFFCYRAHNREERGRTWSMARTQINILQTSCPCARQSGSQALSCVPAQQKQIEVESRVHTTAKPLIFKIKETALINREN
uniref:Uncharacterized protein n=1 Tax=Arundo donax TaxID=35708 RepID=A0A0A9BYS9_ARUDO